MAKANIDIQLKVDKLAPGRIHATTGNMQGGNHIEAVDSDPFGRADSVTWFQTGLIWPGTSVRHCAGLIYITQKVQKIEIQIFPA